MDITSLSELEPSCYDVVIEKGTLDAMLVEEKNPWKLSDESKLLISTILKEVINIQITIMFSNIIVFNLFCRCLHCKLQMFMIVPKKGN